VSDLSFIAVWQLMVLEYLAFMLAEKMRGAYGKRVNGKRGKG
jgi:hypothetical protein